MHQHKCDHNDKTMKGRMTIGHQDHDVKPAEVVGYWPYDIQVVARMFLIEGKCDTFTGVEMDMVIYTPIVEQINVQLEKCHVSITVTESI